MDKNNTEIEMLNQEKQRNPLAYTTMEKHLIDGQEGNIEASSDMSAYECILNCIGATQGCLRTWLPFPFCCCPYPYVKVEFSMKGIVERFGKYKEVKEAGMYYINPSTESLRKVSMKTHIRVLEPQMILTKDNITVKIDAVVFWRIHDAVKSTYLLSNPSECCAQIAISALRAIAGECTLQEILEEREKIGDKIEKFLELELDKWGIYVEQVFIKDMVIDKDLQSDLSAASKARRFGESKVISARGEVESSKLLRQAADILNSEAAMQIRYFESVQNLAEQKCPKILFLPLASDMAQKK